jgi:Spy/CpxP family protein refolding chaperone
MRLAILFLLLASVAGCAAADVAPSTPTPTPTTAPRVPGAIEHALFAPELALAHADAIALTPDQRTQIADLATTTQASLVQRDRELDTTTAALATALAASPIDEEAAVTASRAVIAVEDEIKLVHLRMLIQIRNALTAEQQAQLTALRSPP